MKTIEIYCPRCGNTFYGDSNNNLYGDCPECGNRIYLDEVCF